MAGMLTQSHAQRLEALRRVNLELQGEAGEISLLSLDPTTRELVPFKSVEKNFYPFFILSAEGKALPPDVQFELQIGETMITDEDAKQSAAIQHGQQRYRVVRGDQAEPGILPPTGPHRYWRLHIASLEVAP